MPVVTALAFKTQDEYNTLAALHAERITDERARSIDDEEQAVEDKKQAAVDERAFVVGELLKLSVWLDYADETGRRKMFHLTRAYHGG
jgi:condensin complex subunit 3